jgi:chromosome segregation ATPase
LTQLKEEYDLIRENCSKTKAVLGKKGESIQELEMRYKDAEARHQKAQNLADAQDAIKELKREMAWAHVAEKEVELSKAIANTARENQRLAQIQVKLDEAQKQVSEAGEKINEAETRMQQAASPEELNRQLDEVNAQVVAGRDELRKAKVSASKLSRYPGIFTNLKRRIRKRPSPSSNQRKFLSWRQKLSSKKSKPNLHEMSSVSKSSGGSMRQKRCTMLRGRLMRNPSLIKDGRGKLLKHTVVRWPTPSANTKR